jgi:hypothetical protein
VNKPKYIVIHDSATKDQKTVDWDAITRFHTSFRKGGDIISPEKAAELRAAGDSSIISPWPYVGYNFGIEEINGELKLMTGHAVGKQGYHCKEAHMNFQSIGICVVGNFDVEIPSAAKMNLLRDVCYALRVNYDILSSNVIGHRDAGLMDGFDWEKGQYKTCPGKLFPLQKFKDLLTGKISTMW